MKNIEDINIQYKSYIKRYILADENLPDVELVNRICSLAPDINVTELKKILDTNVKFNVGITPVFITPEGVFMVAGVSGRTGEKYRGAVLVATGAREPEDNSIIDIGLRELYEELGIVIGDTFAFNIQHSLRHEASKLGTSLESAATMLHKFITKEAPSISCFVTLMTLCYTPHAEMLNILDMASQELSINKNIYTDAVAFRYGANKQIACDNQLFINHALNIINFYEKYFAQNGNVRSKLAKAQVNTLKNLIAVNSEQFDSQKLIRYLIDITENHSLVTVNYNDCMSLQVQEHADVISLQTSDGKSQDFMRACVTDVNKVLHAANITDKNTLLKHFYSKRQELLDFIAKKNVNANIYKPDVSQDMKRAYIKILNMLLYANSINNPRSLSLHGLRQIALGELYLSGFNHGAFIKQNEIVSHVAAARVSQRLNFISIKRGAILYQYARRGGYIGDYYVDSEDILAESVGVSSLVTDPKNPTKVVSRVRLALLVVSDAPRHASVSIAEDVVDSWSIVGKNVVCKGGGKQIYLPLTSFEKQRYYAILAPDKNSDPEEFALLEEIANINNVKLQNVSEVEIRKPYMQEQKFTPDINEIFALVNIGGMQSAIVALEAYINSLNIDKQNKQLAKVLLAVLYLFSGDNIKPLEYAEEYLNYKAKSEHASKDEKHIQLLLEYHLARGVIDASLSIQELQKLLQDNPSPNLAAIIKLDIAIRYNQIAGRYSDEITYDDFYENGSRSYEKFKFAQIAEEHLKSCLESNYLPLPEYIVALIELGFSYHKQKKNVEALKYLIDAKNKISVLKYTMGADIYKAHDLELKLQVQGLDIAIGLNLARLQKKKELIPDSLKDIDSFQMLDEISCNLAKIPMEAKILLQRWIGSNANNLFIEGWFNSDSKNTTMGTSLIAVYRKYIPLDMNKIMYELERNYITELDLAYLGMSEPAGISDELFTRFAAALAKNVSLKKLFIRKFSSYVVSNSSSKPRGQILFEALHQAQKNGQKLIYLSYSASYITKPEEKDAIFEYLRANNSLIVFQPSLYYWDKIEDIKEFVSIISKHSTMKTLLTGIFKAEGAGKVIYNECINSRSLTYIYSFPGTLIPGRDDHAIEDNYYLDLLHNSLGKRKMLFQYELLDLTNEWYPEHEVADILDELDAVHRTYPKL